MTLIDSQAPFRAWLGVIATVSIVISSGPPWFWLAPGNWDADRYRSADPVFGPIMGNGFPMDVGAWNGDLAGVGLVLSIWHLIVLAGIGACLATAIAAGSKLTRLLPIAILAFAGTFLGSGFRMAAHDGTRIEPGLYFATFGVGLALLLILVPARGLRAQS